jgi:pilus assembly protein CpaB
VLLAPKFTDRQTTGSLTIPPGKMAISVQLGDPQRVAGFVLPGSEVAIFNTFEARKATVKVEATGPSTATAEAEATDETTRLLLPRVTVVAVGEVTLRPSTTDGEKKATGKGEEEKPITTAVLTVAATQEEAEKLVHAAQTGELYIGLLNGESKTGPSDGVNNLTLFASEVG